MAGADGDAAQAQLNRNLTIGVATSLLALCVISYALRLVARKTLKSGLWWDDWWMLGVLVRSCSSKPAGGLKNLQVCVRLDECTGLCRYVPRLTV